MVSDDWSIEHSPPQSRVVDLNLTVINCPSVSDAARKSFVFLGAIAYMER